MVHITDTRSQKVVSASATKVWRGYLHRLRDRVAQNTARCLWKGPPDESFVWRKSRRLPDILLVFIKAHRLRSN